MTMGLLDSHAFNGDLEHYLFAFQKFGFTELPQDIESEV